MYKKGDRIRLLSMPNDPDPIPFGSTGTIISVCTFSKDETIYDVKWDSGRTLNVIVPPDSITYDVPKP